MERAQLRKPALGQAKIRAHEVRCLWQLTGAPPGTILPIYFCDLTAETLQG